MPSNSIASARASGLLLHPTSLPSPYGIGDLGPEAERFIDFLAAAGQSIWQVLPLGPTGYGDSPYQCFSAFAGNPNLISPDLLVEDGLLTADEAGNARLPEGPVDFAAVWRTKRRVLDAAFARIQPTHRAGMREFRAQHAIWLEDFALFMALKDEHGGVSWLDWPDVLRLRDPEALRAARVRCVDGIERHIFRQWLFFRQWDRVRALCRARGIRVMGDIPIYVAADSADVWSQPGYFLFGTDGRPSFVAGVPPDYFSATGQLWGNPLYRWDVHQRDGYRWWIDRFRATFEWFDLVRLDHFRGFYSYWSVAASETTAALGEWLPGPRAALFEALENALGCLPIFAENLGVITEEVEALRTRFAFPGMAILQFAFGSDPQAPSFQPHNYPRDVVAYTGTHDNDTTQGWWNSDAGENSTRSAGEVRQERAFAREYLGTDGREMHWALIRAVLASVANTVLIPVQDVLGLGNEARMNLPASTSGNWKWRMRTGALEPAMADRLRRMVEAYGRMPRA